MSDDLSPRLALPFLDAGQAQKEVIHNEAVVRLDMLVQPVVMAVGQNVPPSDPAPGAAWIVGDAPAGAWATHAGAIAGWTIGGWRFTLPADGFALWSVADGVMVRRGGGEWRIGEVDATILRIGGQAVVGARQSAIVDPIGGGAIDSEARIAVVAILAAMRAHGLISA